MALKVGSSDSDTEEPKDPLMVVLIRLDGDEQQLALGISGAWHHLSPLYSVALPWRKNLELRVG